MKILTMCRGGQVRSVGLKYLLGYTHGHDVIACGWESNTPETREVLCRWADYIIVMEADMTRHVPEEHMTREDGTRKLFCYDVGPDTYGYAFHEELQSKLVDMVEQHGLFKTAQVERLTRRQYRCMNSIREEGLLRFFQFHQKMDVMPTELDVINWLRANVGTDGVEVNLLADLRILRDTHTFTTDAP